MKWSLDELAKQKAKGLPNEMAEYIGHGLVWAASYAETFFANAKNLEQLKEANRKVTDTMDGIMRLLRDVPSEQRPAVGGKINKFSSVIKDLFDDREVELSKVDATEAETRSFKK